MSLINAILNYSKKNVLFTTPSHSQGAFIPPSGKKIVGKNFYKADFSEIEGLDNLRNPQSVIKDVQEKISSIYNSKASFMLTNGSTSGVIAAMLSVLKDMDKVLIARNCHISVYNGLVLTGAEPIWFLPEYDNEWNIFKGITAEQIESELKKNKGTKAIIITSPTYEGLHSDINGIANICKKHNIILIVDEAHGSLLNFYDFKQKSAITLGADICINSLHKTAGAPNQCALLHLGPNTKVLPEVIQNSLNLINTTSPSYPLLCAIEATVDFLASKQGYKKLSELDNEIDRFTKMLDKSILVYNKFNDLSKILIKPLNQNAKVIADILNNEYYIEEEFTNEKSLLFITGIGTSPKKINKLAKVLNKIVKKNTQKNAQATNKPQYRPTIPLSKITPRMAKNSPIIEIAKTDAINQVCGEVIVDYPPGIAKILPGEIFTKEIIDSIEKEKVKIIKTIFE